MPTHNEILLKHGFTTRQITDRLVKVYSLATEAQRINGRNWYANAEGHVNALAPLAGSREHAASVISHLSPRNRWDNNLKAAHSLIKTGEAKRVFKRNRDMAKAALKSNDPLATINGPKCAAFAQNMLGNSEPVTLDVWMAQSMFQDKDKAKLLSNKKFYAACERAARLAAARVGESPSSFQAICWLVEKSKK